VHRACVADDRCDAHISRRRRNTHDKEHRAANRRLRGGSDRGRSDRDRPRGRSRGRGRQDPRPGGGQRAGWLRGTVVSRPDGTGSVELHANETAQWDQNGVHYTVFEPFSLFDKAESVVNVVTNAVGSGSDGSTVRMHDVIHVVVHLDGTVSIAFDKGTIDCG
jgi:hypothetical protein